MDQHNITQPDQATRIREIESLPEVQDMFEGIEKVRLNKPLDKIPEEVNRDENAVEDENFEPEQDEDSESLEVEEENPEEFESPVNEAEEEFVDNASSKGKKSNKLRKLYNDRYRERVEKEEALQRVAQLEAMLEESLTTGTYHYGKNVYSELEQAKKNYQDTFNEGDDKGLIEAHIALTKATNAVMELERWASENEYKNKRTQQYNQPEQNYPEPDDQALQQEIVSDWLDSHPYLKLDSKSFNPTIYGNVTSFITKLENNLHQNNSADAIGSEEYFDTIDNYIQTLKTPKRDTLKNIESLSNVGGVRNSGSSGNSKNSSAVQLTLNQDEKELVASLGISKKEYIKHKYLRRAENQQQRYRYGQ